MMAIFHELRPGYLLLLGLIGAGVGTLIWAAPRQARPWNTILRCVIVFLIIRVVTLENPWAWHAYESLLRGRRIGWRQMGVIRAERGSFFRSGPVRYLAVGSSQTDAIYSDLPGERPDVRVFPLGGMFPLDLVLYRDQIFDTRPSAVLLYVAEWDLCRDHEPEHIALAPSQGAAFPVLARDILERPGGRRYSRDLVRLGVGEFFPEYKYGYIFRDLTDAVTGKSRFNPPVEPKTFDPNEVQWWTDLMQNSLTESTIPFHEAFLRDFVRSCTQRGIRVAIVQGRVIPRARVGKIPVLASRVDEILREIARDDPSVLYIPIADQPDLVDDDFRDATHLRREVGLRFARAIVAKLDAAWGPSGVASTH